MPSVTQHAGTGARRLAGRGDGFTPWEPVIDAVASSAAVTGDRRLDLELARG
ncbi:hypothetical protein [Nocardia spumae]|uniref:hypothetical protein n=1 Tax=Nocardia spumae TaxID=2887190 RepID=UPI001D145EA1|nr:hypothetical protein [Nocardia spumae]